MAVTATHIDLTEEKRQWAEAVYGKEVRQATVDAYTSIEGQLNDTVDKVIDASNDIIAAAENANEAAAAARDTAQRAEAAAQEAIREASESVDRAVEAARQATEAANEATRSAGSVIAQAEATVETVVADARHYSDLAESWAVGDTGVRVGENNNNSKYYSTLSSGHADRANTQADRATSEANRAKTEADRASALANIGAASGEKIGLVKPDGVTTVVDGNGMISTRRFYEERVTAESTLNMDAFTEPGFYQFDYVTDATASTNLPFSDRGFLLIVGKGGAFMDGYTEDMIYQEAISYSHRKYRIYCEFHGWSGWRDANTYNYMTKDEDGNIIFSGNVKAPLFNGTATKAGVVSTQNVKKDADTSVVTGSTVVEEYSADGSSNLPGAGDHIVMTMCGSTNAKAASLAVAEEDGRLCTRGRSNGWKDWNKYIHEADIARTRLFNGSLDVGGGVQTLDDDITQYKTIGFFCGSGDQYHHGTMFFGYSTGVRHTIPVGKGYITITSASPTQIEVLENTTGYALRQIWGKKF